MSVQQGGPLRNAKADVIHGKEENDIQGVLKGCSHNHMCKAGPHGKWNVRADE